LLLRECWGPRERGDSVNSEAKAKRRPTRKKEKKHDASKDWRCRKKRGNVSGKNCHASAKRKEGEKEEEKCFLK